MTTSKRALSLRVEEAAQEVNAVLLSALSAGATWFAPLPEAVMTAQAVQQIFGLPVIVAACVAASLELIGVNANAAYNDAKEYNAAQMTGASGKRLQNPRNPLESERRPLSLLLGFYATTTGIVVATAVYNVVIEGAPLIRLLACLFPFASAIGVVVANQRASLRRKVAQERLEVAETVRAVAETPVQVAPVAVKVAASAKHQTATIADWRAITAKMNGECATLTIEELQALLKAEGYALPSARTQYNWLADARAQSAGAE